MTGEETDAAQGIYRITSIARPVDPRFPTNRAVLILLPLIGIAGAGHAYASEPVIGSALVAGLTFVLVAFGAWALTRELAPDDNPAAFVAMALAVAQAFFGADSVLLVFVALFLVRIVNHSTGLAPRPLDALLVVGLTLWAMVSLSQPLLGTVGALAFGLDAMLPRGRRWQLLPAGVCLAAAALVIARDGLPPMPGEIGARGNAFLTVLLFAYAFAIAASRPVSSVGDVGGTPLQPARVQAGMGIGGLVALQAVLTDGSPAFFADPVWAPIAAVPLGRIAGRLFGGKPEL